MRTLLLASAAMLCFSGAAFAQNSNSPMSGRSSNISGSDTRSAVAPRLPTPPADDPDRLLMAAQNALSRGRTGEAQEAQEALERAETRLLDRSTLATDAGTPISGPRIDAIRQALSSLGSGDRAGAKAAITTAMSHPATDGGAMGNGSMGNGAMGNGSMGNGMMGNGMPPAAARPGLNPTTIQPPGGPSVAPASGPGSTAPINPAGQTSGTGNQGSP